MKACIHGDLCRAYWNGYRIIWSRICPARCSFYEPIEDVDDKESEAHG